MFKNVSTNNAIKTQPRSGQIEVLNVYIQDII